MISSFILDKDQSFTALLSNQLAVNCPYLEVVGQASCLEHYNKTALNTKLDLVFANLEFIDPLSMKTAKGNTNLILILENDELPISNNINRASTFLNKPIKLCELIKETRKLKDQIVARREREAHELLLTSILKYHPQKELIGIPTIEGYEFIAVEKIIRCEGLQKCTRIITTEKDKLVSSYNLGEFKKILKPFGFFLPHRSYLINLRMVEKYYKEGTIIMSDQVAIPVARRRKEAFLQLIRRV